MTFQFDTFSDFMAMAGHGPYVWGAYGVTFLVMLYLVVSPLRRRKNLLLEQQRLQRIERQQSKQKSAGEVV